MVIVIKSFQELTLHELYEILKLRVDVFVVEQNCPYPELDDKDQKCQHYWVSKDHQVAAYLRTYIREPGIYGIGRIVTNPNFRGLGIGRLLIQKTIEDIRKIAGINTILIQAQAHLTSYYESFGFKICSQEYLEDNIPHIDLKIEL